VLITLVVCAGPAFADSPERSADFHVTPNGSDANPGTPAQPFATIGRARNEVRKLIAGGLRADVTVLVRGGTYELEEPLVFGSEDSGTDQYSITYAAFPGHRPLISGGRRVTAWKRGDGKLWTAEMPQVKAGKWYFRQLFVDGKRRQRARLPQQGYFYIDGKMDVKGETSLLRFRKGDLRKLWADQGVAEVVVLQKWSDARLPLRSVDEESLTAVVSGKPSQYSALGDSPYWVENVADGLDSPGKWYLNRDTGVLFYWPLTGEEMSKVAVVAPRLAELVRLRGAPGGRRPVQNLRLRGLTFCHSDWSVPATGYTNVQAAWNVPGAVRVEYATNCSIEECTFEHLGTYALELGIGCKDNRVIGNRMADLGGGGVKIGDGASHAEDAARSRGNVVTNNDIQDGGHVYPGCVGIWLSIADGTTVAHNLVYDLPYTGISVGWQWDASPTDARKNRIEFNHIHHVMKLMGDGAGIYTLGLQPGSVLRGNLIHDVERSASAQGSVNNGIYLDEGSKGFHIEGNVVFGIAGEPLFLHQSHDDWHTWGPNSFGVAPDSSKFPAEAAAKAGLEPSNHGAIEGGKP
jgi:hypothetical protein